jgi:methanogenic corrinoid protein MtbC1
MTKKTKKVEKPTKISNEHLNNMQNIINNLNRGQMEIGSLETRKQVVLEHVMSFQNELANMQEELKKEYGTDNINIHDGKINYDEQAD